MHKLALSLSRALEEANNHCTDLPQGTSHRHLVDATLAMCISYRLPLPSTIVESPRSFFLEHHYGEVERLLGGINELYILDLRHMLTVIESFWLARYRMLHQPNHAGSLAALSAFISSDEGVTVPAVYEKLITKNQLLSIDHILVTIENDLSRELPLPGDNNE